jgi:hypothetical protein
MTLVEQVRMLLDEAGGGVFWTDSHVLDALNQVQILTLPLLPQPALVSVPWIVEAGTDLASWPPTIMIPKYVEDTSRQFFVTTPTKLEQYSKGWRGTAPGIPEYFVLWDAGRVRLWPRPDQDYQYTLVGIGWGTELTTSTTDIPSTTPTLNSALAHLAAASLLETTQPMLADAYNREASNLLREYGRTVRNTNSHNLQRIHPSSKFQMGQRQAIHVGRNRF